MRARLRLLEREQVSQAGAPRAETQTEDRQTADRQLGPGETHTMVSVTYFFSAAMAAGQQRRRRRRDRRCGSEAFAGARTAGERDRGSAGDGALGVTCWDMRLRDGGNAGGLAGAGRRPADDRDFAPQRRQTRNHYHDRDRGAYSI